MTEYLPAAHSMQSDSASLPSVPRYFPGRPPRHAVTDDEPLMNENMPAPQSVQSPWPGSFFHFPAELESAGHSSNAFTCTKEMLTIKLKETTQCMRAFCTPLTPCRPPPTRTPLTFLSIGQCILGLFSAAVEAMWTTTCPFSSTPAVLLASHLRCSSLSLCGCLA